MLHMLCRFLSSLFLLPFRIMRIEDSCQINDLTELHLGAGCC